MTATPTVSRVFSDSAGPVWCSTHYEPGPREALHQHSFDRLWGTYDERLRLGLARIDHDGRSGQARVEVQYLTDVSDIQGVVGLTDDEASTFTGDILFVLAMKKSASGNRMALLFRCAYEAGKAFIAAVKSARASSNRTADPHSRSIRSL